MPSEDAMHSPESVIEEYVEACRAGSMQRLRAIFHPAALMAGFYQGEYYLGSPGPFFDEVRDNPAPIETGADYAGTITAVETAGGIASVTLKERGYLGADFTNLFHLARIDGHWKIVCKSYQDE